MEIKTFYVGKVLDREDLDYVYQENSSFSSASTTIVTDVRTLVAGPDEGTVKEMLVDYILENYLYPEDDFVKVKQLAINVFSEYDNFNYRGKSFRIEKVLAPSIIEVM